jgi:hypothetical protein
MGAVVSKAVIPTRQHIKMCRKTHRNPEVHQAPVRYAHGTRVMFRSTPPSSAPAKKLESHLSIYLPLILRNQ